MAIKSINQINKEKIRLISNLKGKELSELCKSYLLKGIHDNEYFKDVEELHDYYFNNKQPNNLSEYDKLYNAYCACFGFYKGSVEYNYNKSQEKKEIFSMNILGNFIDVLMLLFDCNKNLKILNMLLNKKDDNLDDIIEELYMLTVLKYYDLINCTYILKMIYDNTDDFDKLFEPLNNSESNFNIVFKSFLEYFDNYKDYKNCFESVFNDITTFLNHFSEFENNEKMTNIIDNINNKYGN